MLLFGFLTFYKFVKENSFAIRNITKLKNNVVCFYKIYFY